MNEVEIVQVLQDQGALLRGHFLLSSGLHSDLFVQKFRVLEHPRLAQRLGEEIAHLFPGKFDLVASPALGAVILGFTTALAAGTPIVIAERVQGRMTLRRGFEIPPHERTLVVEDVVTTGRSAREVLDLVEARGGEPVGVGALIDRGDRSRPRDLGVPFKALVHLQLSSWPESECPLCRRGQPLVDPGSRRLEP